MSLLNKKTAFVTGAAQGIGRGIAMELAKAGANIVIGDLSVEKANDVVIEIEGLGRSALALSLDVTHADSIEEATAAALARYPKIDILVNNAGVIQKGFSDKTSADDFDLCHQVNVKSIWLMTQAFRSHFEAHQQAKIINIASTSGRLGGATVPAYSASKAAVINLTQSLAMTLAPFDINVNAICPGLVWTPLWQEIESKLGDINDPEKIHQATKFKELASQSPLGRAVLPEDIGQAVVFLASAQAKNITGQALNIDAGVVMN